MHGLFAHSVPVSPHTPVPCRFAHSVPVFPYILAASRILLPGLATRSSLLAQWNLTVQLKQAVRERVGRPGSQEEDGETTIIKRLPRKLKQGGKTWGDAPSSSGDGSAATAGVYTRGLHRPLLSST